MARPSVFPIRPDDVASVWPVLGNYIYDAMQYGLQTHTLEDVRKEIISEKMRLWAVLSEKGKPCGAAITGIWKEPLVSICTVRWLGGYDINDWFPTAQKVLASWAKLNGCSVLRHEGREGWVKYLKPYGYKTVASVVLLDLNLNSERADPCQVAADLPVHPQL